MGKRWGRGGEEVGKRWGRDGEERGGERGERRRREGGEGRSKRRKGGEREERGWGRQVRGDWGGREGTPEPKGVSRSSLEARGAHRGEEEGETQRAARSQHATLKHPDLLLLLTRSLAYDGRGNYVVKTEADIDAAAAALGGYENGLYAEKFAPFVKELAVMVVRK